ncbi:conserved oligomeric Golgi complex subunit 4-like isoform X2 [Bolinopsis microptera]|uniref:conserved oligomeric Golgi complex subunit 4-like isoform X2 n=1 Tax=Bolinopsis microptera TaxID=2820187 RepID=UPI00307A7ADF
MDLSLEDVKELTDPNKIQEIFLKLREQEENVTKDLDRLLKNQAHLETKMKNLNQILPQVASIEIGCQSLHDKIHSTNLLAENVSRKVRQLDMAKGHVDSCIQRVNDIINLTKCVEGVQETMASDNYETAASHISTYLQIDKKLISNIDDDVDGSFAVLKDAELRFINNLNNRFDTAVKENDEKGVERFARLYPLVGRKEDGLSKYSKFLASKVASKGQFHLTNALKTSKDDKRWGVMFADTLTRLFEDTARIVEDCQLVIDSAYGGDCMFQVLSPVQEECIRQARSTLSNFLQTRNVIDISCVVNSKTSGLQGNKEQPQLDQILEEMVIMNSRAELYTNFIKRKIQDDTENNNWEGIRGMNALQQEAMGHYILLETHFIKQSILKAASLETRNKKSLVSSLVDDSCYLIQKSVNRAISSRSIDTACAMINNAASSLSLEVCNELMFVVKNGYPNALSYSWQQGSDEQVLEQKEKFLTATNNLHATADNVNKLKRGFEMKCEKSYGSDTAALEKLMSCISGFSDVTSDFREGLKRAEQTLCKAAVFPKIHPVIAEFASSSHIITEDQLYMLEVEDPWLQEIVKVVDEVILPLKQLLHQSIYDSVLKISITEMTEYLEKLALTCSYNQLGGLLLDKRLRSLVTFLSGITQWSIRDKFARLTQICLILSVERLSEVEEYTSSSAKCCLSITEIKQCLRLRNDFKKDDINNIVCD